MLLLIWGLPDLLLQSGCLSGAGGLQRNKLMNCNCDEICLCVWNFFFFYSFLINIHRISRFISLPNWILPILFERSFFILFFFLNFLYQVHCSMSFVFNFNLQTAMKTRKFQFSFFFIQRKERKNWKNEMEETVKNGKSTKSKINFLLYIETNKPFTVWIELTQKDENWRFVRLNFAVQCSSKKKKACAVENGGKKENKRMKQRSVVHTHTQQWKTNLVEETFVGCNGPVSVIISYYSIVDGVVVQSVVGSTEHCLSRKLGGELNEKQIFILAFLIRHVAFSIFSLSKFCRLSTDERIRLYFVCNENVNVRERVWVCFMSTEIVVLIRFCVYLSNNPNKSTWAFFRITHRRMSHWIDWKTHCIYLKNVFMWQRKLLGANEHNFAHDSSATNIWNTH